MSLVESVENIVVSALAQQDRAAFDKYSSHVSKTPTNEPDSSVVTRDIINAMADKLEHEGKLCKECGEPNRIVHQLRSQASAGTQDDVSRHSTIPKSDSAESD